MPQEIVVTFRHSLVVVAEDLRELGIEPDGHSLTPEEAEKVRSQAVQTYNELDWDNLYMNEEDVANLDWQEGEGN